MYIWGLSLYGSIVEGTGVMEMTLFDMRSEVAVLWRMHPKLLMGHWGGTRFSRQLHFCRTRGSLGKASYSIVISSCEDINSASPIKFLGNDSSGRNGMNDSCSWTSSSETCILDAYEDEYGGIVINPERLPQNPNAFASAIRASLSHWKLKGKNGVWLKLPLDHSELVPVAVKEGFKYHHAEQTYLMLTYWIPEGPCLLPANASHQVGVGSFVVNEKSEVLVVQEKHCASTIEGVWKLPTGFILESEEIFTGAVREVKEETGIDTEFMEVIAFRHAHNVAFEKSDLFFICMLRPLSTRIEIDEVEIQAAKWMPLVEFVKQPFVQGDDMFKKIIDICIARLGKSYCGLAAHPVISKFDGRSSCLYYNVVETQDFNCPGA